MSLYQRPVVTLPMQEPSVSQLLKKSIGWTGMSVPWWLRRSVKLHRSIFNQPTARDVGLISTLPTGPMMELRPIGSKKPIPASFIWMFMNALFRRHLVRTIAKDIHVVVAKAAQRNGLVVPHIVAEEGSSAPTHRYATHLSISIGTCVAVMTELA